MTQLTLNLQGDLEATGETMRSSSLVASRNYANRSQWQEKEKEQKTNAIYGERCFEQFKKLNPHTSSQKTSLVSRILMADWFSSRCALTWKIKGTKFNRLLFQLQPKTHRIDETDAGLLLKTPCSADAYTENLSKKEQKFGNSGTLAQEVQSGFIYQRGMLPTPTAMEDRTTPEVWIARQKKQIEKGNAPFTPGLLISAKMGMLPTPTVSDSNGSGSKESLEKRGRGERNDLGSWATLNTNGKNSQLNPRFVAEMMGFPPNWTELPFLNGEQNQLKDTETR